MSKTSLGIISVLLVMGIAVFAAFQHQSHVQLREENESLREQVTRLGRVAEDNQRLSNTVAQARAAQVNVGEQFQEILKLRGEVARLTSERQTSNQVEQSQMALGMSNQLQDLEMLLSEMSNLRAEISDLRDELRQSPPTAAVQPQTAERPTQQPTSPPTTRPLFVRMIDTHLDTFPDKLKRSVAAQDGESFQEVFGRYLQSNGVDLTSVAGLAYDERTGRVIARAPQPILEAIERLTEALDRTP